MRIAFATFAGMPVGSADDQPTAHLVGAEYQVWSDPTVSWHAYDRVILRSVWDYARHAGEFLAWCERVGPSRLRNPPAMVAWNADKRYLADLRTPIVPTAFVTPAEAPPSLAGEVVVKPNVSAGALDTGRFGPRRHDEARELIARIHASGRVALVQPYLADIEARGEIALVFVRGELSHVLSKRAVLRGEGEAPLGAGVVRAAAAMFEPDLVLAGSADAEQLELARAVHDEVTERFGCPLYARVDLVPGPAGQPVVLELELIEPNLYLASAPGAADRLAAAILGC